MKENVNKYNAHFKLIQMVNINLVEMKVVFYYAYPNGRTVRYI